MKVISFGSLNLDITHRVPHIALPGETLTSTHRAVFPGGKGLNQAVALRRAGMDVYMAGKVGRDGLPLIEYLNAEGIDTSLVRITDGVTGYAMIQVDDAGENSILLYPGENRNLTSQEIDDVLTNVSAGDVVVFQNEINDVPSTIDRAKLRGATVVLNPSPCDAAISEVKLENVDYLFVNELEGAALAKLEGAALAELEGAALAKLEGAASAGARDPKEILANLRERYPHLHVILTLGARGAYYCGDSTLEFAKALPTSVVDSTGAGDTFLGYFMAEILTQANPHENSQTGSQMDTQTNAQMGSQTGANPAVDARASSPADAQVGLQASPQVSLQTSLDRALQFASAAAAIAVSRSGAAQSIPTRAEVSRFVGRFDTADLPGHNP
ncbi:MAG: ribokinase [Actinomycetaceae bacterium]|nr:ribokinase [Actinomycetaceae bacterium]MDY5854247.1 ribokinase [Arcanobacterium sp.]